MDLFGEPKVSQFEFIVFDEDVLGFEVPMGDTVFDELTEPTHDLEEVAHSFLLIESVTLRAFETRPEGSLLGQFENDVEIVHGLVHVVEFDDVGAF